ncbi:hypothetical protein BH20ACI3_BH20ACI3_38270 [soil metagenome]
MNEPIDVGKTRRPDNFNPSSRLDGEWSLDAADRGSSVREGSC